MSTQGGSRWLSVVAAGAFFGGGLGCAQLPREAPKKQYLSAVVDKTAERDEPAESQPDFEMPSLPGDASCRQARSAYHDAWSLAGSQRADLTNGQYGSVLARNGYFRSCHVPARYEISICAAVQDGAVRGATVRTSPRAPRLERCIDEGVRKLSFPAHPRMDVTTTVFAGD